MIHKYSPTEWGNLNAKHPDTLLSLVEPFCAAAKIMENANSWGYFVPFEI